ncbi:MAG: 50S ribosomal protein L24e [Candidatus Micrarchaeia archaeon]|jgi:large subunit ribosomal protein L24e
MAVCTFCANKYPVGTGVTFISKQGIVSHYCSHKCEVNAKMRNPNRTRWSKKYAKKT